ncbi:MAG: SDR family NAD(P)-dependent oxidoreductase, partial [Actinomycetia bacterium]|nr:SDR family NAD(P)-dependent oxidoreductase [Actinomycetes bacterium]
LGASFVRVDVTDQESVDAAAESIREQHGRLDVLVNNAGISGPWVAPADTLPEHLHEVYDTNVYGVVRLTRAFVPLLEQAQHPIIVNVSSGMGSLGVTSDPQRLESTLNSLTYTSSKAALNMITTQYAKAYPGIRINAVDPGYTATDFNGRNGTQTIAEGTDAIVTMASATPDDTRTGTYTDRHGVVPW